MLTTCCTANTSGSTICSGAEATTSCVASSVSRSRPRPARLPRRDRRRRVCSRPRQSDRGAHRLLGRPGASCRYRPRHHGRVAAARRGHALLLDCGSEEYRHVPLPERLVVLVVDSGVRHSLEHSGYAERRAEVERGDARRLRHVTSENERVRHVVAALEGGDLDALGPLFRAGHDSLRDDFEVSTPELALPVDLAYERGAVAPRMTGGGTGGH